MMKWTAGSHPADVVPGLVPAGHRGAHGPVWTVGYGLDEVRTVKDGSRWLTVAGVCGASETDLRAGMARALAGDLRSLTHWAGAYVAAAGDGTSTVVVGDLAGRLCVYVAEHQGALWWSTSVSALASLIGSAPDPVTWTAELAVNGVDRGSDSGFPGVRRVPPGHALVCRGQRSHVVAYEPATASQPTFAEAATAIRAALVEAVNVRGTCSSDLSGGLDSTTLAWLAASRHVTDAYTLVDSYTEHGDDLRFAADTAGRSPFLRHHVVRNGETALPYMALDDVSALPVADLPSMALQLVAAKATLFSLVAARGGRDHLSGYGGDNVFFASDSHLADLWRAGHPLRAARRAGRRARLHHAPVYTAISRIRRLAAATPQGSLDSLVWDLTHGNYPCPNGAGGRSGWCGLMPVAAWLTPQAREAIADRIRECRPATTGAQTDWLYLRLVGHNVAAHTQLAHTHGVRLHAPYLDNAVVRAALALPGAQRTAPPGAKPLLAAAMSGLVPDTVYTRTTKGEFSGAAYAGIRHNIDALSALLSNSRLADAGILDRDKALRGLEMAAAGVPGLLSSIHVLVTTEVWLASSPWRRTSWERRPAVTLETSPC